MEIHRTFRELLTFSSHYKLIIMSVLCHMTQVKHNVEPYGVKVFFQFLKSFVSISG